jgi:dihydroxyacetone kinase-like predicted kinase
MIINQGSSEESKEPMKEVIKDVSSGTVVKNTSDERTRLIQRQGSIQHAVISQSVFSNSTNYDEWWNLVQKTADKMVEYINRE